MVPRLVVVSQKIPADDVVDIAVAVVVDAVARRLARILPDIGPIEIGVVPVEPAVDDRDDDRPGIGAELGPAAVGGPAQPAALDRPLVVMAPAGNTSVGARWVKYGIILGVTVYLKKK